MLGHTTCSWGGVILACSIAHDVERSFQGFVALFPAPVTQDNAISSHRHSVNAVIASTKNMVRKVCFAFLMPSMHYKISAGMRRSQRLRKHWDTIIVKRSTGLNQLNVALLCSCVGIRREMVLVQQPRNASHHYPIREN